MWGIVEGIDNDYDSDLDYDGQDKSIRKDNGCIHKEIIDFKC